VCGRSVKAYELGSIPRAGAIYGKAKIKYVSGVTVAQISPKDFVRVQILADMPNLC